MRKFSVAVERMSKEEQQAFVKFCRSKKLGWWHWIENFWLIVDNTDTLSVAEIRDKIREITGGTPCVVLAVREAGSWAGTKRKNKDNMFDWVRKNWFGSKES